MFEFVDESIQKNPDTNKSLKEYFVKVYETMMKKVAVDDQIHLAKEAQDEFKPSKDLKAKLQKPLQAWCHTFDLTAA